VSYKNDTFDTGKTKYILTQYLMKIENISPAQKANLNSLTMLLRKAAE
jgi:hypothetical protein